MTKLSGLTTVSKISLKSEKIGPGISHLKHAHKQTNRKPCIQTFYCPYLGRKPGKRGLTVFKSLNQQHHLVVNQMPHTKPNLSKKPQINETKKKKAFTLSLKETFKNLLWL